MATMTELEAQFLKAHDAGDRQTAGALAAEIKRRRGASAWGDQAKAGAIEGLAGVPGAIGDVQDATGRAAGWVSEFFGASPETAGTVRSVASRIAVPGIGAKMPTSENILQAAQPVTGELAPYDEATTGQKYMRAGLRTLPSAALGPGRATAKLAGGVASGLASEAAGQATEGSIVEPLARFTAGLAGGVAAGGAVDYANRPAAPLQGYGARSQKLVAQSLRDQFGGDVNAAVARSDELGPDAMVLNLGRRPATDAAALAAQPTGAVGTITRGLQQQREGAGARVEADWQAAVGPSVSRHQAEVNAARTREGASDIYDVARGRTIDAEPVWHTMFRARQEAGNDRASRAVIDGLAEMLMDPRTGNVVRGRGFQFDTRSTVSDAQGLLNIRQAIDTRIRQIGATLTNNPADDVYQLGSRTPVGRHLTNIRRSINETLHQDPALREADRIFAGAEATQRAYDTGRTKVLGVGDNYMEPEALRAILADPRTTAQERAALLQGMAQRGSQMMRDTRPNRNEGAAFGSSIATPNNLDRIAVANGPEAAARVRNMAQREDVFAKDANRILNNSNTADKLAAQRNYPSPNVGEVPIGDTNPLSLTGVVSLLVKGLNKATGNIVGARRARVAEDAARLLTVTGEERGRVVRSLMGYANSLQQNDPVRALIMRALVMAQAARQNTFSQEQVQ